MRCGARVGSIQQQRWLWHAINHHTGLVLAYVLADHKDAAFIQLKAMLEPFGIQQFYTDDWGAYQRYLAAPVHTVGRLIRKKSTIASNFSHPN